MDNNVIVGDSFGTDLPKTQVDEDLLDNEKKLAKYSKSKEFQALKEYLELRIEFFQSRLPQGEEVRFADYKTDIGIQWMVANNIIAEFKAVLARYEQAREVVELAKREGA